MSAIIEHGVTQTLERIQRRWAVLLRRAAAREAATRRALVHARSIEAVHRNEISSLHGRLRGLEQILLDYAVSRRVRPQSPAGRTPMRALASPPSLAPPPSLTPPPPPAHRPAPAPLPFDPAAIVAAILPLEEPNADAVSVADALKRLRSATQAGARAGRRPITAPPTHLAPVEQTVIAGQLALAARSPEHPPLIERPPTAALVAESTGVGDLEGEPAEGGPSWFPRALRRLVAEDPRAAGRLLLQLLPAQGLVWPEDVVYTLDVADTGCVTVTVRGDTTTVQPLLNLDPVRTPVLSTDLAGLARTVTARRGWGRIGARLSGARGTLRPLHALASAPLGLRDLERQGVRLDPTLLLRLLALAIDPEWTAQHEFTVGLRCHDRPRASCFIHVNGSAAVAVTSSPPLGRVAGTLSCDAEDLLDLLLDRVSPSAGRRRVSGDGETVAELLRWLRAVDATTRDAERTAVPA